jgi:hypothetical protein
MSPDRAPDGWGARGPEFKSRRSDQLNQELITGAEPNKIQAEGKSSDGLAVVI